MSLLPRPEIENLKVCPHGGINYAELSAVGIAPEAVLDFSVCTNPFMPPPGIKEMLNSVAIEKYPDCEATELRQRLSDKLGVPPDNILVGSGTTELIRLIALAYFRQGDNILILEPTYGEYEIAAQIVGAKPIKQWLSIDPEQFSSATPTILPGNIYPGQRLRRFWLPLGMAYSSLTRLIWLLSRQAGLRLTWFLEVTWLSYVP